MTFEELVTAVVLETKRPDLGFVTLGGDDTIVQKVKEALLFIHGMQKFPRDLRQDILTFDPAAYRQTVDTKDDLTRFRMTGFVFGNVDADVSSIADIDPSILENLRLRPQDPTELFWPTPTGTRQTNTYYLVGRELHLRSSTMELSRVLLGYYQFPNLDYTTSGGANFDSWVARDFPYAVIARAASAVFASTGKQEQSRKYDGPGGLVQQQLSLVIADSLETEAR